MNMVHGTLVVEPAEETASATAAEPMTTQRAAPDGSGGAAEAEPRTWLNVERRSPT